MLARQVLRTRGLEAARRCASAFADRGDAARPAAANTTDKFIVRSPLPDVDIPHATIPELVWQKLDRWKDHTAVVCNSTGRSFTYGELRRRSRNLAGALRNLLKLPRGSCVAILLPNVPEYPIALLGAMEAGIIITTVNPIYTAEEISRQLADSDAKAIITLVELYSTAMTAAKGTMPIITVKTSRDQDLPRGAINFNELCDQRVDAADLGFGNPDDLAIMPYSSGTTGLPKGVQLTHRNIVANIQQVSLFDGEIIRETSGSVQDVVSCVLPMFHIYGMTVNTFKMLGLGTKLITLPKFTPESFVDMLTVHQPHHLFVVPPIVIFMAAHNSVKPTHLRNVSSIMSGAAPLGATDVDRLFAKADREIATLQGYGLTETSPAVCSTLPDRWRQCLGSIGTCLPNTHLKVVSVEDNVTALGPGGRGELFVKGPQVMRCYHNNPQATADVFQDGWFKTGDMVYYDDNEIVWITDRLKELIKVKGFQVAPAELEAIIRNHPAVADAAVIGVPHPLSGEVPRAFVVPKSGATINTESVQEYVAKQVASYKRLEGGVTILNAIPKTPSGKIMRRTLRSMCEEEKH